MEEKNNDEEMCEVNVTEVVLDEEEIDEIIEKLKELKQTKKEVEVDLDDENELLIKHEDFEE